MTQSLAEEAKKEMTFALEELRRELKSFSSGGAAVQRIQPALEEFARQHELSRDDLLGDATGGVDLLQRKLEEVPDFAQQTSKEAYVLRHSLEIEENRLPSAIEWLREDLEDKLTQTRDKFKGQISQAADDEKKQGLELLALAHETKLVREYTDIWTIYRVAMEQHQRPGTLLEAPVAIADRTAHELYSIVRQKDLSLHVPEQVLITVFFMNELYTRPSRTAPLPYIVIPRWSSRHIWAGSAAAHEVGHNVFWNVKGLFDELLVALMLTLTYEGFSYDHQRVWGRWLEEIFADLFGLLQIGPAIIRSQQRMFAHVPLRLLRKLSIGLLHDVIRELWVADDMEHPVEYLRVWLSIEALKMLADYEHEKLQDDKHNGFARAEIDDLEKRWRLFLGEEDTTEPCLLTLMADGEPLEDPDVPAELMLEQGRTVLRVVLFTPLHALAGEDDQPRSVVDVFHHTPQYEEMETVTQELLGEPFSAPSFKSRDLRTVLAAAEYAFEQKEENRLGELGDRLSEAIQYTPPLLQTG